MEYQTDHVRLHFHNQVVQVLLLQAMDATSHFGHSTSYNHWLTTFVPRWYSNFDCNISNLTSLKLNLQNTDGCYYHSQCSNYQGQMYYYTNISTGRAYSQARSHQSRSHSMVAPIKITPKDSNNQLRDHCRQGRLPLQELRHYSY